MGLQCQTWASRLTANHTVMNEFILSSVPLELDDWSWATLFAREREREEEER